MQVLLATKVLRLSRKTGAQKENFRKKEVAAYIAGEAMAMCSEESSLCSSNSAAAWRAAEVNIFHLSFTQIL